MKEFKSHHRPDGQQKDGLFDWWNTTKNVNIMVEVGTSYGESAEIWMKMNPNLQLICIDPWNADVGFHEKKDYGKIAFNEFKGRLFYWPNSVAYLKMGSQEACGIFPNHSIDAVYIDADHSYKGVKRDIGLWKPKIKKGGWLGGHDYNPEKFPGVISAIHELMGKPLEVFQDKSWIFQV